MDRYIALDAHTESTTCAVVGPSGKRMKLVVVETSARALIELIEGIPGRKYLVIEEGTHSAWLYELLSPLVEEMAVVIPGKSAGNKSDAKDAWDLAEEFRKGNLKRTVYKRPRLLAPLRAAVRTHRLLTSDMVRVKNRLRALFRSRGIGVSDQLYDSKSRQKVLPLLPLDGQYQAMMLGLQLDALVPILERAQEHLQLEAKKVPSVAIVSTLPGFGLIRAATFVAATINPARFRTTRQFWSYAGLAIVTRSSSDWVRDQGAWERRDDVKKTRGLNRNRHPWLKSLLKGAATTIIWQMPSHPLHADYQRVLQNGTKPNLAALTISRRLASAALACWKKMEVYEPSKHKSHFVAAPQPAQP